MSVANFTVIFFCFLNWAAFMKFGKFLPAADFPKPLGFLQGYPFCFFIMSSKM